MTDFVNIQIDRTKYIVDPMLQTMLDKLVLVRPDLVFKPRMSRGGGVQSAHKRDAHNNLAPDEMYYLHSLNAIHNDEIVGSCSVDTRYSRSNGSERVYAVHSWRIRKQRGAQDIMRTAKVDYAVREAKRVFVARNIPELFEVANNNLDMGYRNTLAQLRRPIVHNELVRQNVHLQEYAYHVVNGYGMRPDLKKTVEEAVTSEKYKDAMSKYYLTEKVMESRALLMYAVDANTFAFIVKEVKGDESDLIIKSYDELPPPIQERVAVLRFAKDEELVDNVGYRHDESTYRVLCDDNDTFE